MVQVKPEKICLATRFFDLRNGGEGRFSMELYQGLRNRGYAITPVSTNRESTFGHVIYSTLELAYKMPKGCDVYHCLTPMEAIHAPKILSVVTFHDLIPWLHVDQTDTHYVHGPTKPFRRLLSKAYFEWASKVAARCSLIACNSEQTALELMQYLDVDSSRVSVIRFGIRPDLKPEKKKDKVFRIGTLSYLDTRKRIDLLIQAFLDADVDGELVIGGKGVDYPRLQKVAQGDKRIKFVGFVPDDKMTDFYNSLDLFVFPSRIEGYGLPIVEALACKKQVVLLSDALIPDEIKVNCTVVDSLKDFLKDPKPALNLDAGYAFAKQHDWDKCVEEYIGLYQRLLED